MAEQRKIPKLAGVIVEHQENFAALSDEDAQWAIQNTVAAIAHFCEAVRNRTQETGRAVITNLFEFVCALKTPGVKEFVAKKKFVRDTSEGARVRISWIGENFKRVMLTLVERDVPEEELKLQKLLEYAHDLPEDEEHLGAIAGLGGMSKARVSLCAFYESLAHKQAIGDFSWLVGYVRDGSGVLWAVDAGWSDDGWGVGAYSLDGPGGWGPGREVLSR